MSHQPPPSAATLHQRVNQAIETHLALWFTPESVAAITAQAGPDALALIREISGFAQSPEFWVYGDNMQNYHDVQPKIREKFPFLSSAAVVRIATSAAYGWK